MTVALLSKVLLPLLKLALSPMLKMVVSSVSSCAHALLALWFMPLTLFTSFQPEYLTVTAVPGSKPVRGSA